MNANLLRVIVQTGADDATNVRCYYSAGQPVDLVLLIDFIFLLDTKKESRNSCAAIDKEKGLGHMLAHPGAHSDIDTFLMLQQTGAFAAIGA